MVEPLKVLEIQREKAYPGEAPMEPQKITVPDEALENLSREALVAEVKALRAGIRKHRDSTGHELCWHHPALWALLPERTDPLPVVPEWPQFLEGCLHYRRSLDAQLPAAPRSDKPYSECSP
jgi:hypothetical protein